jgi:hypothetical protein
VRDIERKEEEKIQPFIEDLVGKWKRLLSQTKGNPNKRRLPTQYPW